jgi:hypothetical protein
LLVVVHLAHQVETTKPQYLEDLLVQALDLLVVLHPYLALLVLALFLVRLLVLVLLVGL